MSQQPPVSLEELFGGSSIQQSQPQAAASGDDGWEEIPEHLLQQP